MRSPRVAASDNIDGENAFVKRNNLRPLPNLRIRKSDPARGGIAFLPGVFGGCYFNSRSFSTVAKFPLRKVKKYTPEARLPASQCSA